MGENLARRILRAHLVSGETKAGEEIGIRIDQTLTQDATGTMAWLQFESMGVPRVRTELSVSYVDHNTIQMGYENPDDHRYLQSAARKYGAFFSRPGNGICHQVHLEQFARPGRTLLGSDSHTPTCGALGMIAIGAGGLDVAVAMGGGPFYLKMPAIVGVRLTGSLPPWASAKDVILELLRRLTVRGGVGKIFEYFGPGLKSLDVFARATIANMGAELGATTSVFPSDKAARTFLRTQGREGDFVPMEADGDAAYDETIDLDLSKLEPLVACPHSPDNVRPVRELAGTPVAQVCIGSCVNGSWRDLMVAAGILRGGMVHPDVSMTVSPGSRRTLMMLAASGGIEALTAAGARLLECACGPCIGMGQSPASGSASLRSFNRNFEGRSGTDDAAVYLASPEVCAASALRGAITDPRSLGKSPPRIRMPRRFSADESGIIPPETDPVKAASLPTIYGPNIKPAPKGSPMPDSIRGRVAIKLGDNITTDHIMPAGEWLKYRSNVPKYSEAVFVRVDPSFPAKARQIRDGGEAVVIVGGANYGQGSSREHAAMVPMFLGLKCVLAVSFARIHRDNLVNFGVLPLTFADPADVSAFDPGDEIFLHDVRRELLSGDSVAVMNSTKNRRIVCRHGLTGRQIEIVLAGGLLAWTATRGA
ncbi:MAG: aconitate hydratase [Planctomycetota bacterium]|nr:aconitate hydratase [Planctomycetota bacterium]